jgi:hypothetical protein
MSLDIKTPLGQKSLQQEREAHDIIRKKWGVEIVETPKDSIAAGDGFLIRNGEIVAFFETKCRYDMTYEQLLDRGTWLVTMDKIKKCKAVSKLLQVPFLGFLYLLPNSEPNQKLLLFVKITDNRGEYTFEFKVIEEPTQRTINGGETVRANAHFPVDQIKVV